jgi:hypothetical protein
MYSTEQYIDCTESLGSASLIGLIITLRYGTPHTVKFTNTVKTVQYMFLGYVSKLSHKDMLFGSVLLRRNRTLERNVRKEEKGQT